MWGSRAFDEVQSKSRKLFEHAAVHVGQAEQEAANGVQLRIGVGVEGGMIFLAIGQLSVAVPASYHRRIIAPEICCVMKLHAAPIIFTTNATPWVVRSKRLKPALLSLLSLKLFFGHSSSPFKSQVGRFRGRSHRPVRPFGAGDWGQFRAGEFFRPRRGLIGLRRA